MRRIDYNKRYRSIKPYLRGKFSKIKRPNQLSRNNKAKITRLWHKLRGIKSHYQVIIPKRGRKYRGYSRISDDFRVFIRRKPAYKPPVTPDRPGRGLEYDVIREIKREKQTELVGPEIEQMAELEALAPSKYAEITDLMFDPVQLIKDPAGHIKQLLATFGPDARVNIIAGKGVIGGPAMLVKNVNDVIDAIKGQMDDYKHWADYLFGLRVTVFKNQQ